MTTPYCTVDDIENRLSADGVTYRVDDVPPTTLGDVINEASATIDEHAWKRYSAAALATSDWVRHRCADIATFLLCERRGNPVPIGIAQKMTRTMEKLERILEGTLDIPFLAVQTTEAPVLSSPRVRLDPFPRTVITRSKSTGEPVGYDQNVDRLDWGGYGI